MRTGKYLIVSLSWRNASVYVSTCFLICIVWTILRHYSRQQPSQEDTEAAETAISLPPAPPIIADNRAFVCPYCEKRFKSNGAAKKHIATTHVSYTFYLFYTFITDTSICWGRHYRNSVIFLEFRSHRNQQFKFSEKVVFVKPLLRTKQFTRNLNRLRLQSIFTLIFNRNNR